jgi:hypothetical protein
MIGGVYWLDVFKAHNVRCRVTCGCVDSEF